MAKMLRFGDPLVVRLSKGEKSFPGPICATAITQIFTLIGGRYLSRGKKIHIFPYRGLPSIGGYRPILYILESCPAVELIFSCNWHATVTLRLTVFDIFTFSRAKIWGIPGVPSPKGIRPTRDRCKLSRWSARDICSRAKKYIFSL